MPLANWNLEWLNHNASRSYPLVDWGNKIDQTGTVAIPSDFLIALYFPVHAGMNVEPDRFYVQFLGIYPTGYNLGIGYFNGSNNPLVASVNIAKNTHTENRSYALAGSDDFDDSMGKVVIGSLENVNKLPPGHYFFDYAAAALETDAIWPMIRGISSLTVVNVSDRSPRIHGDVELVAGENMRITASQVGSAAPQITFSAIDGEGLNEECGCDEEEEGPCMRFINGIPPLPNGNFRIVGSPCIEITPVSNGLRLHDKCSEPCCGCEELEALIRQIHRFADGAHTLQNFASRLGSEVTQMSQVVLGSRLADGQGCIEC